METSGDRDPLLARAQIEVIRNFLSQVNREDSFTVMTAGTRVRFQNAKPQAATQENINSALGFLESAHLIGALDLGKALTEAQTIFKENPSGYLVHVGSGIPAMGERRQDVLVKRIPDGTRYVGVGVGKRWGRSFMKAAAERSAGHFTQINPDEAIAWRAFDLFATLQTPRLLNVQVSASTPMLVYAQALSQGEEICALTRCESLPTEITVRGILDGKPFERLLPVKNVAEEAGYLPHMWAKLEIDRLLAKDPVKNKKQVVELSKAMYVMSPFTSLLVLENEDMYVQYKVDKGRKDHWAMYPCPNKIAVVYEPLDGSPDPKTLKAGQKLPAKTVLGTIALRESTNANNPKGPMPDSQIAHNSGQGRLQLAGSDLGIPFPTIDGFATPLPRFPELGGSIAAGRRFFYASPGNRTRSIGLEMPPALLPEMTRLKGPLDGTPMAIDWSDQPISKVGQTFASGGDLRNAGILFGDELTQDRVIRPVHAVIGLHSGGRTQFASVFVSPQMEWAIPNDVRGITDYLGWRASKASVKAELYSSDPNIRMQQVLEQSEDLRQIQAEWSRFWVNEKGTSDRAFFDLVAYAPGMNTSWADIDAVLEAEALPVRFLKQGQIDPGARDLLDKARKHGWQTLTIPAAGLQPAYTITFDGSGRFAYERKLWPGITEKVVCDGKTLVHLYPELKIGARRTVSSGHRADFNALVPWALPPARDLARGADVKVIDERTVAIVPIRNQESGVRDQESGVRDQESGVRDQESGVKGKKTEEKWVEVRLLFGDDGRLAERHLVLMPKKEILYRLICAPEGTVKVLDAKGKELAVHKLKLASGQEAPRLAANTKDFVVLDLPYRTPEHVKKVLKIENKQYNQLSFKEALPLFAAFVAAGNGNEAHNVFRQVFQLGFYVLLAACGQNLDSQNGDVLAEHIDEPLAQYLALHSSPVLRKHASQWAVQSGLGEGALRHLAVTHALLQRWQNERIVKIEPAKLRAERQRALDYIKDNHDSAFGWALLSLLQERAGKDKEAHRAIADSFRLFEKVPGLGYAARYEHARCLFKSGQVELARKQFQALYEDTFKKKMLPAIDGDFRQALQAQGDMPDLWIAHCRKTAAKLIEAKRRPAVLALAWQTWQLGDQPLANHLLAAALDKIADAKEKTGMTLGGIAFLQRTGQLARADQLLTGLLNDLEMNKRAGLWRLAAELAGKRDMTARSVECLENALDREFKNLPEVIDLESVRKDYGKLLEHYQGLADAMVALKLKPPASFLARVVKTADRWRALDREATSACQTAAAILRRFHERARPGLGLPDHPHRPVPQ